MPTRYQAPSDDEFDDWEPPRRMVIVGVRLPLREVLTLSATMWIVGMILSAIAAGAWKLMLLVMHAAGA
ncbi:MAG: hypothetical protein IT424_04620 [Pirellulales bacterium]|nr:hypothetical protein [Pirellulales bacterium]